MHMYFRETKSVCDFSKLVKNLITHFGKDAYLSVHCITKICLSVSCPELFIAFYNRCTYIPIAYTILHIYFAFT